MALLGVLMKKMKTKLALLVVDLGASLASSGNNFSLKDAPGNTLNKGLEIKWNPRKFCLVGRGRGNKYSPKELSLPRVWEVCAEGGDGGGVPSWEGGTLSKNTLKTTGHRLGDREQRFTRRGTRDLGEKSTAPPSESCTPKPEPKGNGSINEQTLIKRSPDPLSPWDKRRKRS